MSIYGRLVGQAVTLLTHSVNSAVMLLAMQDQELMKDPEINSMASRQGLYLTVWNVGFQLAYFSLAIVCDYLTVIGKQHLILKGINELRLGFFSSILFPISATIFLVFWPFFICNRELLFPAFIDQIFSFKSNLVIHFFIFPAVLWELAFLPRKIPTSHWKNITVLLTLAIVYVTVIYKSYLATGNFPYPMLNMIVGTIFFPITVIVLIIMSIVIYYYQWTLTSLIWKKKQEKVKLKKLKLGF